MVEMVLMIKVETRIRKECNIIINAKCKDQSAK